MSPGSFAFNLLSSITTVTTGRAVIRQSLAIMEAAAGTLACVKNDDKVATSNDLICVCDGLDCSVDESGRFVISFNCEEGEAVNFSCVSGVHSSGVDSSPDNMKCYGTPKTTNKNATSQASFKHVEV
ncbi:hypothetical protein BHYA_0082g00200 [Botrytis hyacinthi]|uniref:Uncharacterized protein n=1 Tax=Botrytis hyacinthi TaxID=278943 RepID=A0A4Z1GXP9_9HELO|nr:hypothetical protein BHYA_0082g00200 [Botrytis hyacinthi]